MEACWHLEAVCGRALGTALSQADLGPIADSAALRSQCVKWVRSSRSRSEAAMLVADPLGLRK